jgi:hypothetical protein
VLSREDEADLSEGDGKGEERVIDEITGIGMTKYLPE